jgi:hypothetical protein
MATQPIMLSITCAQCGKETQRPYRGSGVKPTLCGNACKIAAFRQRSPDRDAEHRAREVAAKAPRLCRCGKTVEKRRRTCPACLKPKEAYAPRPKQCRDCGAMVSKGAQRCTSCRDLAGQSRRRTAKQSEGYLKAKRAAKARRRAVERGIEAERFDPLDVLMRDGWRCHICGINTPKHLRGTYDDRAPELDHIVALAEGGKHTRLNTACSCRKCNGAKGARSLGQMRMTRIRAGGRVLVG